MRVARVELSAGRAGAVRSGVPNGRWRDTLSAEEVAAYEAKALAELGSDCAWWLAMGEGAQP